MQGDFKTVILKVISITPGQAPDFNAAKAQIIADLQMSEAQGKALDLSNQFDDLRQGGASIADAAAKLGLTPETVGPVTADGKDPASGQPIPNLSPKLLAAAFQTPQGGDSDVTADVDKGEYFAVHVDQVIAPGPRGLDEPGVRQMLTSAYFSQTIIAELKQKAADAVAALQKGQTFEAVAPTYGGQVSHQVGMTRSAGQQLEQTLGQELLAASFDAKTGQVFTAGSDKLGGLVVARLDATHPGDPKQVAAVLEIVRQRGSQAYLEGLQGAVRDAAVRMIKPQTDLDLARSVMGVDAAMVARATGGATNAVRPAP
jgi:peptidyl-prolyl cis-trans isomerase D